MVFDLTILVKFQCNLGIYCFFWSDFTLEDIMLAQIENYGIAIWS